MGHPELLSEEREALVREKEEGGEDVDERQGRCKERSAPLTERNTAVHAATRLLLEVVVRKTGRNCVLERKVS
jgi:hypothetical protein